MLFMNERFPFAPILLPKLEVKIGFLFSFISSDPSKDHYGNYEGTLNNSFSQTTLSNDRWLVQKWGTIKISKKWGIVGYNLGFDSFLSKLRLLHFIQLPFNFDTEDHQILLKKFNRYDYLRASNDCVKPYLPNRNQYVPINRYECGFAAQESVLGSTVRKTIFSFSKCFE